MTDPAADDIPMTGMIVNAEPLTAAERGTPGFNQLWYIRKITRATRQLAGATATEDEGNFIDNIQPDHANGALHFRMDGVNYTLTVTRDA